MGELGVWAATRTNYVVREVWRKGDHITVVWNLVTHLEVKASYI